ncbi:MAG: ASPIC/UnbV domain-containing protein, partial [bacterium]|nr:ASPIC/UnbV domain-containing protein [bacterium]
FDYDRDGDLDIFVVSANGPSKLYRNNGGNTLNYLTVKLRGNRLNSEAIGARVYATVGDETQMRELRAGSNFVSQNPAEAHFGLDAATSVDALRIVWPDGKTIELTDVPANQMLTVGYPQPAPPSVISITPNTGDVAGGEEVVIAGANYSADFPNSIAVTIGGADCASIVVDNDGQITCNTPAGTEGAKDVVVTATYNATGATSGTLVGGYTFTVPVIVPLVPRILDIGPNPSASQFTIRFELPSDASGSLLIYDVAGRLVSQFGPFTSVGNPRTVFWNGTNTRGNPAAAGVYFLRLETTRGSSDTRKIVIVR